MLVAAETSNRKAPYDHSQSNNETEEWLRMPWVKPEYKRGEVDRAGDFLVNESAIANRYSENDDIDGYLYQVEREYDIINNWRSSHSYPLQIIKMTLRTRAKRIDAQAIVAQRIKRLSSIKLKLDNNPNMKLSQMQDLGGCRAILGTPRRVFELGDIYEKAAGKNPDRPQLIKKYDYIKEPKPDGYRSLHFVFKYNTPAVGPAVYNGLRVEVQLRSRLQHAWATAVETVSTFTGQALKSKKGDEAWRRFFALMGSALAHREHTPMINDTPKSVNQLKKELRECTKELDVQNRLRIYGDALQGVPTLEWPGEPKYYLLQLDLRGNRILVNAYREEEFEKATNEYLTVEKLEKGGSITDAVLVSVDSMASLRRAYPNYFLDTRVFIDAVNKAIA
jgi:ppGpp synthetase/RelA/SpoT-type nucleotidyltranferase